MWYLWRTGGWRAGSRAWGFSKAGSRSPAPRLLPAEVCKSARSVARIPEHTAYRQLAASGNARKKECMFQRWVRLRTRLSFGFTALYLAPCSPKAEHQDTFLQEVLCELKQYAISAIIGHCPRVGVFYQHRPCARMMHRLADETDLRVAANEEQNPQSPSTKRTACSYRSETFGTILNYFSH